MRNQFRDLPPLDPPNKAGGDWTVVQDWVTPEVNGVAIHIRAGMRTDGASKPRITWSLIGHPFQVPLLGPALGHDALYSGELVPRAEADRWFRDAMKLAGIGWIKRNTFYAAVRAGGWAVWRKHTRQSVARARWFAELI